MWSNEDVDRLKLVGLAKTRKENPIMIELLIVIAFSVATLAAIILYFDM